MRELSRGGSLVANTIASLQNRAAAGSKHDSTNSQTNDRSFKNPLRKICEDNDEDAPFRISAASERPVSTASEASERDSASLQSSEEPPLNESGDSDSPDETTVKCTVWTDRNVVPARADSSDSDTTSSQSDSEEREYETGGGEADYHTLTPSRGADNTTRCNDDFRWMPTGEIVDDNSEPPLMGSQAGDYSAASLERRRRTSGSRNERDRKSRSSLSAKPPQHPSSVRASPRPRRSRNEETPPDLQRRWNSYEHFRWPENGWWPPMCWCHGPPPMPPPCYMQDRTWPSHPSLPPMSTRSGKVRNQISPKL